MVQVRRLGAGMTAGIIMAVLFVIMVAFFVLIGGGPSPDSSGRTIHQSDLNASNAEAPRAIDINVSRPAPPLGQQSTAQQPPAFEQQPPVLVAPPVHVP